MLVVFDLNGVFVDREYIKPAHRKRVLQPPPSMMMQQYALWIRPGMHELLSWLLKHQRKVRVAVWSSMRAANVKAVCESIFPASLPLLFAWDQSHCVQVDDPAAVPKPDGYVKPLFLKPLQKVWDAWPEYGPDNTLLVDDTRAKSVDNPPHCCFVPSAEWTRNSTEDCSEILHIIQQHFQRVTHQ